MIYPLIESFVQLIKKCKTEGALNINLEEIFLAFFSATPNTSQEYSAEDVSQEETKGVLKYERRRSLSDWTKASSKNVTEIDYIGKLKKLVDNRLSKVSQEETEEHDTAVLDLLHLRNVETRLGIMEEENEILKSKLESVELKNKTIEELSSLTSSTHLKRMEKKLQEQEKTIVELQQKLMSQENLDLTAKTYKEKADKLSMALTDLLQKMDTTSPVAPSVEVVKDSNNNIKYATFNYLLKRVLEDPNCELCDTFLITYQLYMPPKKLLREVMRMYTEARDKKVWFS